MNIEKINTVEDLKSLGSIEDLKKYLNRVVTPLKVEASSYNELFDIVHTLKEKWGDFMPGPFVSEQAEYIYYLTKLEGKQRNDALGITDDHYTDKEVAKKWFRKLSKLVHADKGGNDIAWRVLNELHNVLVEGDADGDPENVQ